MMIQTDSDLFLPIQTNPVNLCYLVTLLVNHKLLKNLEKWLDHVMIPIFLRFACVCSLFLFQTKPKEPFNLVLLLLLPYCWSDGMIELVLKMGPYNQYLRSEDDVGILMCDVSLTRVICNKFCNLTGFIPELLMKS